MTTNLHHALDRESLLLGVIAALAAQGVYDAIKTAVDFEYPSSLTCQLFGIFTAMMVSVGVVAFVLVSKNRSLERPSTT